MGGCTSQKSENDEHQLAIECWDEGRFGFVKTLQEATRNYGHVDEMLDHEDGGRPIAVKRMPRSWIGDGPDEFAERHPDASEQPWIDISCVQYLNSQTYTYACDLLGVFLDYDNMFVATSLATHGDLLNWVNQSSRLPAIGRAREDVLRPIAWQMFDAVSQLHELGIAHRDISLENILLTGSENAPQLKLIDFGAATSSRFCRNELRGKASYQAPEMHTEDEYDAFLCDSFAVGVALFCAVVGDYPWLSTLLDRCRLFNFVHHQGFRAYVEQRKVKTAEARVSIADIVSSPLLEVLEGSLAHDPQLRLSLGEPSLEPQRGHRSTVWDMQWVSGCSLPGSMQGTRDQGNQEQSTKAHQFDVARCGTSCCCDFDRDTCSFHAIAGA